MDTILGDLEFFTKSGITAVSKKGFVSKSYIDALLNSNIEFNANAMNAIKNFKQEIQNLGKACKNYQFLCRSLLDKRCSPEEIIETLGEDFPLLSDKMDTLKENVDNFLSENNLKVHSENKIVWITQEKKIETIPEKIHEESSSEKSASEEFSPSESSFAESLAVSNLSDKNLLADHIFCEVGFPLYSNKKGLHSENSSRNYTSVMSQPELKITVTKAPSGKHKVFLGVSCDLNFSFSNIKKVPFEKQNMINLRIKNTTVKEYCSLHTTTSEVFVSIGQMFQVNNQRCGIFGNFAFKEKKFQSQNFSFKTQMMTAPIVKTVKTNTCCMVTPSLGFEFFPFLDINTLTNTNTSEKTNNLLVQAENITPVGLEAENYVSEKNAYKTETQFPQPVAAIVIKSHEYEIPLKSIDIVTVKNKPEQGVAVDSNPTSYVSIQREYNTRVGVFGVALIIGYMCMRYVKKRFWQKNSENL